MAQGFQVFEKFEAGKFVYEEDLKHMRNRICGILNNWTPNYKFWYNMYSIRQKHIWFVGGDNREVCHQLQNVGKQFAKTNWLIFLKI